MTRPWFSRTGGTTALCFNTSSLSNGSSNIRRCGRQWPAEVCWPRATDRKALWRGPRRLLVQSSSETRHPISFARWRRPRYWPERGRMVHLRVGIARRAIPLFERLRASPSRETSSRPLPRALSRRFPTGLGAESASGFRAQGRRFAFAGFVARPPYSSGSGNCHPARADR